ncbi:MAG: hypothetical protein HYU37_02300 [Acidobacteria bacterium]|nr:hypothetical protein [Acidobacteriota bacterium]
MSTSGGRAPRWRGDGRELFYLTPTGMLMALSITPGSRVIVNWTAGLHRTVAPSH